MPYEDGYALTVWKKTSFSKPQERIFSKQLHEFRWRYHVCLTKR